MRRRRLAAVVATVLAGLGVSAAQATGQPSEPPTPVTAERPMIALTFDDGPSRLTPQILDALNRHDVPATFFMQGSHVSQRPEIAGRVAREGHVVANHGYSHRDFTTLSHREASREITRTNRVIRRATGTEPVLFRYPFGRESEGGNAAIRREGMWGGVLWHWTVPLSGDFECPGAEAVADYVAANATDQAITLLHDGNEAAACGNNQIAYLDTVIPELKAQGYDFGVVAPAFAPSPVNQQSWVRVVTPEEARAW